MPDKTYLYCGPLSAVSLPADAEHPGGRNVQLPPGQHVTLPDDNDYVRTLVARKYLVPVVEPEAETPPAPATEVKPATTSPSSAASPATGTGTAAPAAATASNTTGAADGR